MNAVLHANDAPSTTDEYLFYQTVAGTLPAVWLNGAAIGADAHADYVERLVAYALKAAREAKLRTSWTDPQAAYEDGLEAFVRGALARERPFFRDACAFAALLGPVAAVGGLAQVALKLGAPGVPDVYQGCELWDFSLVDPDNRRPVDYAARSAMLASFEACGDRPALLAEMLEHWPDGRIKLYVTWCLLQLRRRRRTTFLDGPYRALEISGSHAAAVVAFARDDVAFVVPRLIRSRLRGGLQLAFDDERIALGPPEAVYRSVLDDRTIVAGSDGMITVREAFRGAPLAVLTGAASTADATRSTPPR
jgi:(1->4)-alpha-D-glucan 1-alpha-D-glucosylmutase